MHFFEQGIEALLELFSTVALAQVEKATAESPVRLRRMIPNRSR